MKAVPLLFLAAACCAPPPPATLAIPVPPVVSVESAAGFGSGTVIRQEGSRTWVLTSAHNKTETVEGQAVLERHEHPYLDAELLLVDLDPVKVTPMRGDAPAMGELLMALGHPLAGPAQPQLGLAGETAGKMSCPSLFGMSGGPVVDAQGRLVGIVDSLTHLTRSADGQDFYFPSFSNYDTAAKFIARGHGTRFTTKFAKALKEAAHRLYGIPAVHFAFEEVKDEPQDIFFGKTPREAYIALSETFFKPLHGQSIFGSLILKEIAFAAQQPEGYNVCVISDCGFREEIEPVVAALGADNVILVRLHRDGCDFEGDSRSYIDLDDLGVRTLDIENNGTTDELAMAVQTELNPWIIERNAAVQAQLDAAEEERANFALVADDDELAEELAADQDGNSRGTDGDIITEEGRIIDGATGETKGREIR
ncbi:Uncharacterized protein SCF082_LOCUS36164 [Durusdinium trenchii]|uniref:Serine protease n=1 Tax=Durusdinium trenchii TaxID=1381693 RepID=A0ABP0PEY8_9DINO